MNGREGTRRGTAVALPLAVLTITLLVPVMLARHAQGSHARGNVTRTVRGGYLVDQARAALTEAWWQLERASADPADPIFLKLRGDATAPQSFALEVPHLLEQLKNDTTMAGITLTGGKVNVTVGKRVRTSNRTREGACEVKLEAKLVHEPTGLVRVLRETREIRLALLGLPPPFDDASLVVLDATNLVGPQTNAWMEEAVSLVTSISVGAKAAGATDIGGEPPAPLVDDLAKEIHRFPSKYLVRSSAPRVDAIADLLLRPRIEAIRKRIEAMGPPTDLAGKAITDPDGAGKKAKALAQAHVSLLEEARGFQKALDEQGGADADQARMLSAQLSPAEWRRRAFFTFEGQGAAARCLAMLDGYAAENPPRPVNGIIYVDNAGDVLKLTNRTIRGRVVIVATGPVKVEEVKLRQLSTDLLVVQAGEVLETNGRIEGSLVALGGVQLGRETVIAGSLILSEVRALDQLGGRIEADPRLKSTVNGLDRPEMFWIAFSPTCSRQLEAP